MYRVHLNFNSGTFQYYATMNNIGSYPIIPTETENKYDPVPLNHNIRYNYPIEPVEFDVAPIINVNKISNIICLHKTASSAIKALETKLPFSRIVNYILAKNMIL
eukprot:551161_1